jgi:hypothetical protein
MFCANDFISSHNTLHRRADLVYRIQKQKHASRLDTEGEIRHDVQKREDTDLNEAEFSQQVQTVSTLGVYISTNSHARLLSSLLNVTDQAEHLSTVRIPIQEIR